MRSPRAPTNTPVVPVVAVAAAVSPKLYKELTVFITLTTDFAKQSPGVGMMEAAIAEIAPRARLIHYAHGLDDFDTTSAARVLETVAYVAPRSTSASATPASALRGAHWRC